MQKTDFSVKYIHHRSVCTSPNAVKQALRTACSGKNSVGVLWLVHYRKHVCKK